MTPTVTAPRRTVADRPRRANGRRAASPRLHRRLSGPVGGRGPGGALPRVAHAPRESVALGGRALALVRGLPDHSLIDRLVRGRAWIPVLGVLLTGIVAMQVEILKLGTTMGRALERSSTLQTQNDSLQASVASLADDQRIERLAAAMGMTMPPPTSLVFLNAHPSSDVARAISNIHAPDPAGFTSQLAAQAAAAAALMPAAPAATTPATTTTTPASTTTASAGSAPSVTASTGAPAATTPTTSTAAPGPAAASPGPSPSAGAGGPVTTSGAAAIAPPGATSSSATAGG